LRILVAVDGSKYSDAAIQQIMAQCRPLDSEIRVLHVIEPMPLFPNVQGFGYAPEFEVVREEQVKLGEDVVSRAAQVLRDAGYKVTTAVEEGFPKVVILDHATQWRADLIMLGSHGRKGLDHFLIGSVSEAVARHAPCSVQIARPASH